MRANRAGCSFLMSDKSEYHLLPRARHMMKSNLLFCYGHKKGKSMVKRTNLKQITLKKSESLLHKEWIASETYSYQFIPWLFKKEQLEQFALVALFVKSDRVINSCCSLLKEGRAKEQRAKKQRAKERKSEERKSERAISQPCYVQYNVESSL